MKAWLIALPLCVACADGGDPVKPLDPMGEIVLVPDPPFSNSDRRAMSSAAESWNLEFGTSISVGSIHEEFPQAQVVVVSVSDPECKGEDGKLYAGRAHLRGYEIEICPTGLGEEPILFETMRHEIGHVLGMGHVTDPWSVMYSADENVFTQFTVFTTADRGEFDRVNPDFVGRGGCDVLRVAAENASAAQLFEIDGVVYLAWATEHAFRFAEVDPATGAPVEALGSIATAGSIGAAHFLRTQDGLRMVWEEDDGVFTASVTLPSFATTEPTRLDVTHSPKHFLSGAAQLDASTFVAIGFHEGRSEMFDPSEIWDRELSLYRFDGTALQATAVYPETAGRIVAGDELYGVFVEYEESRTRQSARLSRLDTETLLSTEAVDLQELDTVVNGSAFTPQVEATVTAGGVIVTIPAHGGLFTRRVVTAEGLTTEPPTFSRGLLGPSFFELAGELYLAAVFQTSAQYHHALMMTPLDRASLAIVEPRRPVSATSSLVPRGQTFVESGNHIVGAWTEGLGQVRSRCLLTAQ